MYSRKKSRWLKHLDFIIVDMISISLALYLAYSFRHGFHSSYAKDEYQKIGLILILIDMIVIFFRDTYKSTVRRGYLKEFIAAFTHDSLVIGGLLVYLFLTQQSLIFSRLTIFYTWGTGFILMYVFRIMLKMWLRKRMAFREKMVSVLLVASQDAAEFTLHDLLERKYRDYDVIGVILLGDTDTEATQLCGVPVVSAWKDFTEYIKNHVVDEVFVNVTDHYESAEQIMGVCVRMGITVHQNLAGITRSGNKVIDEFAGYTVLTSSIKVASRRDLILKRLIDMIGGSVGIILTVLMFPFLAFAIKRKSPGPVLFSQERMGKNGRKFKIYKFRSMYVDAEERKKELEAQNEMQGLMFKIKEDPRIIPGIGEFIRKTSLDEFPQFWNVLKGDMSLVGTRPPTVEEYEKYDIHHLGRMSIKPGLTGMWQVSGRNRITDFEEVVKLDMQYIQEWSLSLDIKILFKTVGIVLLGKGE